jgi:hypothetical protein
MNSLKGTWANLFGDEPVKRKGAAPDWAKVSNSPKRGRTAKKQAARSLSRASTRSQRRAAARSPSPPRPKEGTLKKVGNSYQIYKKGAFVAHTGEVYNAEGRYGGPYSDMRQLQANSSYIADMEAKYGKNWKEAERKARRAAKVAAKGAAAGANQKGGKTRRHRRA